MAKKPNPFAKKAKGKKPDTLTPGDTTDMSMMKGMKPMMPGMKNMKKKR